MVGDCLLDYLNLRLISLNRVPHEFDNIWIKFLKNSLGCDKLPKFYTALYIVIYKLPCTLCFLKANANSVKRDKILIEPLAHGRLI